MEYNTSWSSLRWRFKWKNVIDNCQPSLSIESQIGYLESSDPYRSVLKPKKFYLNENIEIVLCCETVNCC